jgi:hypothetical protein
MDLHGLDSDSRTTLTFDGCHNHIRTRIQSFKYFMKNFWSLILYRSDLKSISCQGVSCNHGTFSAHSTATPYFNPLGCVLS